MASVVGVLSAWNCLQFLRNDDKTTREGLIKAGQYQILWTIVYYAALLIGALNIIPVKGLPIQGVSQVAGGAIFSLAFGYYYLTVYRRYAEMI